MCYGCGEMGHIKYNLPAIKEKQDKEAAVATNDYGRQDVQISVIEVYAAMEDVHISMVVLEFNF